MKFLPILFVMVLSNTEITWLFKFSFLKVFVSFLKKVEFHMTLNKLQEHGLRNFMVSLSSVDSKLAGVILPSSFSIIRTLVFSC